MFCFLGIDLFIHSKLKDRIYIHPPLLGDFDCDGRKSKQRIVSIWDHRRQLRWAVKRERAIF